jgi:hypothetical protein
VLQNIAPAGRRGHDERGKSPHPTTGILLFLGKAQTPRFPFPPHRYCCCPRFSPKSKPHPTVELRTTSPTRPQIPQRRRKGRRRSRNRFSSSMEDGLKLLEKNIASGRLKDPNNMKRRLGKIQTQHPSVKRSLPGLFAGYRRGLPVILANEGKTVRPGASRAEVPICCAPISRQSRRSSCGRSTCS